MKRKRRKTRSAASYRAGSLKAHRTMERMRQSRMPDVKVGETYVIARGTPYESWLTIVDDRPTINLLPKVTWP